MTKPITLRDCPMCHEGVHDEGVILSGVSILDLKTAEPVYTAYYTVKCCQCGVFVEAEYLSEVVALWNGTTPVVEDDEIDL